MSTATATVSVELNNETITDAACGNGPVDAVFKAIDRIMGITVKLEDFNLKNLSSIWTESALI